VPVRLATDQEIQEAKQASREILAAAAAVCTQKELETLVLYEQGLPYRMIGLQLGVSYETIRARLANSMFKIRRHLAAE
jgi:DNA-binding CsgD family transcriptional regulator